jgi:hypothetical protein
MKASKLTVAALVLTAVLCCIDTAVQSVTASPVAAFTFGVCLVCDLLAVRTTLTDQGKAFIAQVVKEALNTEVKPPD